MIITLSTDKLFSDSCAEILKVEKVKALRSFRELRHTLTEKPEDIVIVDLNNVTPFDLTQLKCNVLVLTGVPKFNEAIKLMRFGIRGYGNRMMNEGNLTQAVNSVRTGQVWMPPFIMSKLITSIPENEGANDENQSGLSEREQEVAKYVATGLTNKEIAEEMEITVRTVKAHMTSIFNKTGLRDRVALALQYR